MRMHVSKTLALILTVIKLVDVVGICGLENESCQDIPGNMYAGTRWMT
jgi:hypothetical protein